MTHPFDKKLAGKCQAHVQAEYSRLSAGHVANIVVPKYDQNWEALILAEKVGTIQALFLT